MPVDKKTMNKAAVAKKPVAAAAPARKVVGSKPVAAPVATKKAAVAPVATKKAAPQKKQPAKKVVEPSSDEEESEDDDEEMELDSDEQDNYVSFSDDDEESTPKKGLLDDESEEEEDDFNSKTTAFSDQNKSWLKMKRPDASDDESSAGEDEDEEEEDSDDEEKTEFEKQADKSAKKKRAIDEANRVEVQEDMRHLEHGDDDDDNLVLPSGMEIKKESLLGVDIQEVYQRIKSVINTLENFSKERKENVTRDTYMLRLRDDLATYFGYSTWLIDVFLKIFNVSECLDFLEANEVQRPLTIRTNTLKTRRKDLAETLGGRGVHLEPIKWSPVGLTVYETQVAIGATPEYLAGHYIQQSASSFLPVVALAPQPEERVLDMCASPGGKTTYIASLMKNTGVLVANDINEERMRSLVANIHRLGVRNTIVSNLDGREYPNRMSGFDRVLVDAPCVGLGVISKDPQIKMTKSQKDVSLCTHIQKELLLHAIDSVDATSATGGIIVYSTCSLTVEENEGVVDYALKKRNVQLVDTTLEFGVQGFTSFRNLRFHPTLQLTRRYYPHTHNMDGFYVAKFKKLSNEIPGQVKNKKQKVESTAESNEEEEDVVDNTPIAEDSTSTTTTTTTKPTTVTKKPKQQSQQKTKSTPTKKPKQQQQPTKTSSSKRPKGNNRYKPVVTQPKKK
eukprot:gene8682-10199_t